MADRRPLIAIDGVAGAGKSTLAAELASRLGVEQLDTGAMYRAVALLALRHGVDTSCGDRLAQLARTMRFDPGPPPLMDQVPVGPDLRTAEVDAAVSPVASHPAVRAELVRRQREWIGLRNGAVVEGRDIGSVVAPDADLKLYLVAQPHVRASRRAAQRSGGPGDPAGGPPGSRSESGATDPAEEHGALQLQLEKRDLQDRSRVTAPLAQAPDARVLDTSAATVDELVRTVMSWL
ncbi:MAG: (d)CMP kinase [Actinomycetota bacterium]|nr:(d)CMP kinase [Actinomycetota bacterium]